MSSNNSQLSSVQEEKRRLQLELQGLDTIQTGECHSFISWEILLCLGSSTWRTACWLLACVWLAHFASRFCCFIDAENRRAIVSRLVFNLFGLTDKQRWNPFAIISCLGVFRTNTALHWPWKIVVDVLPHVLVHIYSVSNRSKKFKGLMWRCPARRVCKTKRLSRCVSHPSKRAQQCSRSMCLLSFEGE